MHVLITERRGIQNFSATIIGFSIAEARQVLERDFNFRHHIVPTALKHLEVYVVTEIADKDDLDDLTSQLRQVHLTFPGVQFKTILDVNKGSDLEYAEYKKANYFEIACYQAMIGQSRTPGTLKAYRFNNDDKLKKTDLVKIELTIKIPRERGAQFLNSWDVTSNDMTAHLAAEMQYLKRDLVEKPEEYVGILLPDPDTGYVQSILEEIVLSKERTFLKALKYTDVYRKGVTDGV
jgi:hypothetical protein